jgi:hypothetical protein
MYVSDISGALGGLIDEIGALECKTAWYICRMYVEHDTTTAKRLIAKRSVD